MLYRRLGARALFWPVLLACAWALGWTVTAAVGVRLEDGGWTVFGSSGAVVVTVLSAALPLVLRRSAS